MDADPDRRTATAALAAALGGSDNVREVSLATGRLVVQLRDAGVIKQAALDALGIRGVARLDDARVHLLHADAESLLARE